jgi:hypothetical protein
MTTITIEFKIGNAAFDDPSEIERILVEAAREIVRPDTWFPAGEDGGVLIDSNGNTVGSWGATQ